MQDKINPVAGSTAGIGIANVAFDKAEAPPLSGRHAAFDLLEIPAVPGGEIIETDHLLVEFQQRLQKIAANEAGGPGNQPPSRGLGKVRAHLLIAHHSRHMRNPASRTAVRSKTDLTSIKTPPFFSRDKSSRRDMVR